MRWVRTTCLLAVVLAVGFFFWPGGAEAAEPATSDTSIPVLLMMALAGILLNAFFAGYETGFVASNPVRVRYLAEQERNPTAMRLLAYQEHPDRMITVVLLGTNVALVMGTMAITDLVRHPVAATVIATPLFLFFGEILPKSMFRLHPTRLALRLLPFIRFFDSLFFFIAIPVTWLSQRFLALMADEQREIRQMMGSQDDVRVLVDESADHGAIEPEEKAMIHSVMDLQTQAAKEVMIPRIQIQALPDTATRKELAARFTESGFTRLPIYTETIDNIIGAVSAFDVLADRTPENADITRFLRPVVHVPDTMKLDDVLAKLRAERQRLAIVTDEYGGTDGLITVEDILEEIFGEIHDEHDKTERLIRKAGKNAWVVDARMPLEDAAKRVGPDLVDEEVETVGGWIMHQAGRIPAKGEVIVIEAFKVTVLEGSPNALGSIRLERQETTEHPEES